MPNNTLPVANFRDQILSSVAAHAVTIIVAETGAGKSTQVPQYLLDAGHDIVVTQPRRLAARTVAERVAEEFGCALGGVVGFRTAQERSESKDTRCLFVTDGLALVRELMGAGSHSALVLDEAHEWNLNIETLVAWAKAQVTKNASFKLVLMSATLEAEALSKFFDGAPVINVPGRLFPVTARSPAAKLVDDVVALVAEGRNVLVFQPGKAEIEATIDELRRMQVNAEILPLHGELTSAEQKKCFAHYGRPKVVVSTNVAQTSVTIDDIDAVVDSGMERRVELVNGVEGLYLRAISRADSKQRAGRAGRTKPGVYIDHCNVVGVDRRDFPVAEIERVRLDQTVLRLAIAGFNMEELRFFHQPAVEKIHAAKVSLQKLGCMDASGRVSAIGRAVSRLPISVQFGRMVVEAERLGVVGDIITAAAILESGELNTRKDKDGRPSEEWRLLTGGERESDVIAQMRLYDAAGKIAPSERFDRGIHPKGYQRVKDLRKQIEGALQSRGVDTTSSGKREHILLAICSGMVDHLYQNRNGSLENGESRERAKESVVALGQWAVGLPFDLQITTRRGMMVLNLVRMLTSVTPAMLEEVAPQLVERKAGLNPRFDTVRNEVVSTTEVWFNGVKTSEEVVASADHPEATRVKVEHLYSSYDYPPLPVVEISKDATVPNVTQVIVGHHPETGAVIAAYSTYQKDWYERLVGKWVRDRREADMLQQGALEQAVEILARKREEALQAQAEAKAKAERIARLRPKFKALNRRRETLGMSVIDLREEGYVSGWYSSLYEFGDEALAEFTSETDAHESEVKEELAKRAEEARKQAEEEKARKEFEAGNALNDFRTNYRRGGKTGCCDAFVITSDGVLRAADSRGNQLVWNWVRATELALQWSCHHIGDVAGNSTCDVVHLPKEGATAAQLATVAEVEKSLGLPEGAFGLNPVLTAKYAARLEAIQRVSSKVLGQTPDELTYHKVASQNGVLVSWEKRVVYSSETTTCDARDAYVQAKAACADGVLEFVAYDKYGQMNISMRFRERAAGEVLPEDKVVTGKTKPASQEGLASLLARFAR